MKETSRIAVVVFDFGGVMTTTTMPEHVRAAIAGTGISWETLADGFARYRRLMDGGFITAAEMYDNIWADAGADPPRDVRARIIEDDFRSYLSESANPRTLAWMRALKSRGYRLAVLTNMPPEFAPKFRVAYAEFLALTEAHLISGEERMFKPQPRIYRRLQERLGAAAGEICFVDDVEANCEGARRQGWRAIRFESNGQVERDFEELIGKQGGV